MVRGSTRDLDDLGELVGAAPDEVIRGRVPRCQAVRRFTGRRRRNAPEGPRPYDHCPRGGERRHVVEGRRRLRHGTARFADPHTLNVDEERLTADRFIVATGSHAALPPIPGLTDVDVLTNENVSQLRHLPDSRVVLGAGAIGVELSQAFGRLGIEVTLVELADTILPNEETEVSLELAKVLQQEGVRIRTGGRAGSVREDAGKVTVIVQCANGEEEEVRADRLFVAVGRRPKVEGVGLDLAGVDYGVGSVSTGSTMQTNVPHIYAVGDLVGPYLFSHMARRQARTTVDHIVGDAARISEDYAWCTFTHPELARTGHTEAEVRAPERRTPFTPLP